jgi:hypothetical protein
MSTEKTTMNDSSKYGPYAGCQMWKNQLYNSTISNVSRHRTTDRHSISNYMDYSARLTKTLLTPMVYGAIGLQHRPENLSDSKTWLMPDFFGDPFHHQVHHIFYDTLKPCGFYHNKAINALCRLIVNLSFVRYTVFSETRQINNKAFRIKKGQYISASTPIEDRNSKIIHSAVEANSCRPTHYSSNYFEFTHFDLSDIFFSSYLISNSGIGLFILPSGSVFWFKKENKWVTCVCEYEMPKAFPRGKVKINFREIDEDGIAKDEIIFCCVQREQYLHKTIAKMIKNDEIRIAISNIKSINNPGASISSGMLACAINANAMSMLMKNFHSSIFDQLKIRALQNTNIKKLKNFDDLVDAIAKNRRNHLTAIQYSGETMLFARKEAVKACNNNTPLFWELGVKMDYITNAIQKVVNEQNSYYYNSDLESFGINQEIKHLIELDYTFPNLSSSKLQRYIRNMQSSSIAIDMNNESWLSSNMYSYLRIDPKHVKNRTTPINVKVSLDVTKTEICKYSVEMDTSYNIPTQVKELGENAVSKFIKYISTGKDKKNWDKEIKQSKDSHKITSNSLNNEEKTEAKINKIKVLQT